MSSSVTIPGLREDDAVRVPLRTGDVAVFWSLTPHAVVTSPDVHAYSMQFAVDGTKILHTANNVGDHHLQWLVLKDGAGVPKIADNARI